MLAFIIPFSYSNIFGEGAMTDDRTQTRQLYQLQAEFCRVLADPTRIEILELLAEGPLPVKRLVELTGQRQAKISQHLAIMRQLGVVQAERVGTEMHYSLTDRRILEACHLTRAILIDQLACRGSWATQLREQIPVGSTPVTDTAE